MIVDAEAARGPCRWCLCSAALLTLLCVVPARAQSGEITGPRAEARTVVRSAIQAKISSHLLEARQRLREGEPLSEVRSARPAVTWEEERMEVEVRLDSLTDELLAELESAGLEVTFSSQRHARAVGRVAPDALEAVAALAEVATIHPLYGSVVWTGSVDNQADSSIRADLTRASFGVDGTGVEVGVLSDSFHDGIGGTVTGSGCSTFLSGSGPQGSGDLPATVRLLDNGPGGGSDEGAGMAELIHDLAPGSPLAFHSAGTSEAEFASGIDDLRTCGADVIVDDVLFFAEPMFQDGPVAQAAQDAFDAGVPYYSSAGNSATFGVLEIFADSGVTDDTTFGDDFHDFGSGDRFAEVTVPAGCTVRGVLQWNDPFDGTLGPGASDDLDLLGCTSATPADCILGSTDAQGCSMGSGVQAGDPLEILTLTNGSGSAASIHFAVHHFCGDEDVHFRIALFGLGCSITTYGFEPGIFDQAQVYGHSAAAGADAVAAVFYGEVDTGGTLDPPSGQIDVEPFSALGGELPYYFDGSGDPLPGAPVTRFKPQIAAPDGTNTSFFGSDIGYDADAHPNFFGTSAAAPHAAAVAALLRQASPTLDPSGVRQVLAAAAVDIEGPGTDDLSGAGLIDALDTVQTVSTAGTGCIDDLMLSGQEVSGSQFFRACQTITAGSDFVVAGSGDLTFRAGESIVITSGFSVQSGGSFTAEIDPSL